jgi:RND family efflux transporter MFP subunit
MLKKLSFFILILIAVNACDQQNEEIKENVSPVKIYTVKLDSISQFLHLTGSVEAENDAIIYAKISEKVEKIHAKVGQNVRRDEVIAVQYNEILKQNFEMAKAGFKSAESQFSLAEQNYNRMKKLFDRKAVSPQQYDQSEAQFRTAEAALDQARSQIKQAEENYVNSFIKAPFSGIVAAINFEEDQMVSAGQPVAHVINPKSMKAKLTLTGADINRIKIDQPVKIEFPSIENRIYTGKVVRINKALNPLTNSLEIEVRITDTDKNIRSGIFGKFNLEMVRKKDVIVIPETAIQQQTEVKIDRGSGLQEPVRKYYVFKIVDNKAQLNEIEVGINNDGRREVTSGLAINDKIVIVGQNIVKDGDRVKIIE